MKRLKNTSHCLHGSGFNDEDSDHVVMETKDLMRTQLSTIHSMQKMYEDGVDEGLGSTLKSSISNVGSLVKTGKETKATIGRNLPNKDAFSDVLQNLEDVFLTLC